MSDLMGADDGSNPIVDLRHLPAPEPMAYILDRLDQAKLPVHFRVLLPHEPHPLYPHLLQRRAGWSCKVQEDGSVLLACWIKS